MPYRVISECVDRVSGKRHFPGPDSFFPETDAGQVQRLEQAGCLKYVSGRNLDADQKRAVAETREAAAAELEQIEADLTVARNRKDEELRMIADEIGQVRREADEEKARIAAEVEDLRKGVPAAGGGALDPAEVQRQQINDDQLFDRTVPELKEIAAAESVELVSSAKKEDVIAAIRAKRAGQPAS